MRIPVLGIAFLITLSVLCHTVWHHGAIVIANYAAELFINGHVTG